MRIKYCVISGLGLSATQYILDVMFIIVKRCYSLVNLLIALPFSYNYHSHSIFCMSLLSYHNYTISLMALNNVYILYYIQIIELQYNYVLTL